MNLHMIRAIRLVNAQQNGLPVADFMSALEDANLSDAFDELMRRRGRKAWFNGLGGYLSGLSFAEKMNLLTSGSALGPLVVASLFGDPDSMAVIAESPEIMADIASSPTLMTEVLSSAVAISAIFAVPAAKAAIMASTALAVASVPQMTSDVAPSGVASCGPSNINPAWKAFDKNNATYWDTSLTANVWLQYKFPLDVFVHTVSVLTYGAPYAPKNCRIEYSEDGIVFANAQSVVMAPGGSGNSINIAVSGFYKYWRLFMQDSHGGNIGIMELNFAGFVKP